jgi:hypothetical protein
MYGMSWWAGRLAFWTQTDKKGLVVAGGQEGYDCDVVYVRFSCEVLFLGRGHLIWPALHAVGDATKPDLLSGQAHY